MSEEHNTQELGTEIVVTSRDDAEPSSGVESLAKRYGWNPEGEKSAEDFIEFALKEVPERGKELKKYKKTVDELKVHMHKQQEYAYKQAKEELEAQKRLAQDNNDYAAYTQLEQQEQALQPIRSDVKEAYDNFEEKNGDWLDVDNFETLEMRDWLSKRDNELGKKGLSPQEHFDRLDQEVRKKFSSYFGETSQERPQAVESDGYNSVAPQKSNKKITFASLSKVQKETCELFERMNVMSRDKYIADLVKNGDL